MIRRLFRTLTGAGNYDESVPTELAIDFDDADLITSEVDVAGTAVPGEDTAPHAPVLDIDYPATLIPSTTPGKFHLYLDKKVPWDKYVKVLEALAEADLIEPGYAGASISRGFTAVRLPWVEKTDEEKVAEEEKERLEAEFFLAGSGPRKNPDDGSAL